MSDAWTLVRHPDTDRLYTSSARWRWPAYALARGGRQAEFDPVPIGATREANDAIEQAWLGEFHVTELARGDSVDRTGRVDHWTGTTDQQPPGGVTR